MVNKIPVPPIEEFKNSKPDDFKESLYRSISSLYTGHIPPQCLKFYTEYLVGFIAAKAITLLNICEEENIKIPNFDEMTRDMFFVEGHCINALIDFSKKEKQAQAASENALSSLNDIVANFSKSKNKGGDDGAPVN